MEAVQAQGLQSEGPFCEELSCNRPATAEYYERDEEGDGFYSYKCDLHPEPAPAYIRSEL